MAKREIQKTLYFTENEMKEAKAYADNKGIKLNELIRMCLFERIRNNEVNNVR